MNRITLKLSARALNSAVIHATNSRGVIAGFRCDRTLFNSFVDGWAPIVDGITGLPLLPICTLVNPDGLAIGCDSQEMLDKLLKIAGHHLEIVRGSRRLGTMKLGIDDPKACGIKPEKSATVAALLDSGAIEFVLVSDASNDELMAIANDNDPLKKQWDRVHSYHSYKAGKLQNLSDKEACRKVGYATNGHFMRLGKLPAIVEQAWIAGETGVKDDDGKVSPRLTDPIILKIYEANGMADGSNVVLTDAAAELFADALLGKAKPKIATVASDAILSLWQKEFTGTPFGELLSLVRGYKPGTIEVVKDDSSEGNRGFLFTQFLATHKAKTPAATPEAKTPEATEATPEATEATEAKTPEATEATPEATEATPEATEATPEAKTPEAKTPEATPEATPRRNRRSRQTA